MCAAQHDANCDDGRNVPTVRRSRVLPLTTATGSPALEDLFDHLVEFLREVVRRRRADELRKAEIRT